MLFDDPVVAVVAHAVGYANRKGRRPIIGWRSHYCTDPECDSYALCLEAVARGWMDGPTAGRFFHANAAGLAMVSEATGCAYYIEDNQ